MRLQIIQGLRGTLWRLTALSVCMLWAGAQSQAQVPSPSVSPFPTQVVKLTLIASDKADNSVEDARQEDFQVFEDKQPRPISTFSKDLRPVDYALVIDNSGSFKAVLEHVIVASKSLVAKKRAEDEVFIERFIGGASIERIQDFTADEAQLFAGLDLLYIGLGQSAVIDAVYLAIKHTVEVKGALAGRRRAVVLFTDGEDRASYYGSDALIKLIRANDVQVFIVGIVGLLDREESLIRQSPRAKAEQLLNRIAEESGGRAFFPNGNDELLKVTAQIARDLHFQYLIEFERQGKPGEKGFRKIKVKFAAAPGREKFKVITRPGYLVALPDSAAKAKEKKSQ